MHTSEHFFRRSRIGYAEYLDPVSPLYEPLSYPLFFPFGGRGWGPDIRTNKGCKLSQMWWYRQMVLRQSYMHSCGRLLNEWFLNMYCRMEDARLSMLRTQQRKQLAKRDALCEFVANESQSRRAHAKVVYLPSSVPGSPRHLRKLRTDALELACRKGKPTWLITLTCNPYWDEIVNELLPGQTAADRPDLVVRVFHAKLEKAMAYLKECSWAGKHRYYIKVIEYQERGLPHAHIVWGCDMPPSSPLDVDLIISCELPAEDDPARTLVLRHMVHRCDPRLASNSVLVIASRVWIASYALERIRPSASL